MSVEFLSFFLLFTASAHWADSDSKSWCPWVISTIVKNTLSGGLETSGQRAYRLYCDTSRHFGLFFFHRFLRLWFFFGVGGGNSLQICLLCIIWEFAGGGCKDVAVGSSDKWQVTGDRQHVCSHMSRDSVSPVCGIFTRKCQYSFLSSFLGQDCFLLPANPPTDIYGSSKTRQDTQPRLKLYLIWLNLSN